MRKLVNLKLTDSVQVQALSDGDIKKAKRPKSNKKRPEKAKNPKRPEKAKQNTRNFKNSKFSKTARF